MFVIIYKKIIFLLIFVTSYLQNINDFIHDEIIKVSLVCAPHALRFPYGNTENICRENMYFVLS